MHSQPVTACCHSLQRLVSMRSWLLASFESRNNHGYGRQTDSPTGRVSSTFWFLSEQQRWIESLISSRVPTTEYREGGWEHRVSSIPIAPPPLEWGMQLKQIEGPSFDSVKPTFNRLLPCPSAPWRPYGWVCTGIGPSVWTVCYHLVSSPHLDFHSPNWCPEKGTGNNIRRGKVSPFIIP